MVPFAADKCSGRELANCQAKGFPQGKTDAQERSHPGSGRCQLENQGPGLGRAQSTGLGLAVEEVPAADPGLDAGPPHSSRAITGNVGTAKTTGHKSAEPVSPKGQFEEAVGLDLG